MILGFIFAQASQEKFIDVADVLRDVPQDHIFENDNDEDEAIWDHEARFARSAEGEAFMYSSHSFENGWRRTSLGNACIFIFTLADAKGRQRRRSMICRGKTDG